MQKVPPLTADEATKRAVDYVKKYYGFVFPIRASRQDSRWLVELDISVLKPRHARVIINALTGSIEKFNVVEV